MGKVLLNWTHVLDVLHSYTFENRLILSSRCELVAKLVPTHRTILFETTAISWLAQQTPKTELKSGNQLQRNWRSKINAICWPEMLDNQAQLTSCLFCLYVYSIKSPSQSSVWCLERNQSCISKKYWTFTLAFSYFNKFLRCVWNRVTGNTQHLLWLYPELMQCVLSNAQATNPVGLLIG